MLDELAKDKVKFCKDKQLKKSLVLKQLKNSKTSRNDSNKINFALNGPKQKGISYILFPASSEYPDHICNSSTFDYTAVETIWERLQDLNWKSIKKWERIDSSNDVVKYTLLTS